jgi:hypothetical protein
VEELDAGGGVEAGVPSVVDGGIGAASTKSKRAKTSSLRRRLAGEKREVLGVSPFPFYPTSILMFSRGWPVQYWPTKRPRACFWVFRAWPGKYAAKPVKTPVPNEALGLVRFQEV